MNRRHVLNMAATMAAGLPLWSTRVFAQAPGPVMTALSAYMSAAGSRALPTEIDEQAKHHLLDTLASIISGSELVPGQAAQRYIRAHGGQGSVTVLGTTLTASPADAALANGVMAHADETDDSHNASRTHPGAGVVPAALAAAEQLGCDGTRFLRAVALGYDIGTRVIMAMGGYAFSYESSHAAHSIMSVFGGAAAAGSIANLDARQMRWMLDYTAQQSSGLVAWRRDSDHIEKAFVFSGMGARNGITAALLVHSGWNGVDDIFTGDDNFFQAYAPQAQRDKLIEKLGERYEIALTDIKKWTVGSPIQAPLDGVELIRSKHPFDANQVRRVEVRLAPASAVVVDNREMPDICLQHMVAVMLLDKTASFHAAHDKPRMQDVATLRERAKVALVHDEELTKLLPVRVALVNIELVDGTRLSERVTAVRGTVRNPMSRAEIIDKARDLTAPILGRDKSDRLIETVYTIESVADIRSLRPLFQPG
jgi:2-methylcitrate dehydratase PrpD